MQGQFLCLEGIDGSGKTTLARLLSENLSRKGQKAIFVDKKDLNFSGDELGLKLLDDFKRCVWDYPNDLNLNCLGDGYWMHAISAWYSALYAIRIASLLEQGSIVVSDGWVYKYICRFSLKEEVGFGTASAIFASVPRPDRVLLLDVEPDIAAERKGSFKASESGRFDGENGGLVRGFVNYQGKVRDLLQIVAGREGWLTYKASHNPVEQCVEDISGLIFNQG